MFILTDGKNYVMENPMKSGEYIMSTSPIHATHFTYKKARNLLASKGKKLSWIHNFQMVNDETGEPSQISASYKGNENVYTGENDIEFDENIIEKICSETNSIIGLAGWSATQLKTLKAQLCAGQSKYDSAESDIAHALQTYKEENNGKKPQAHKMSQIGYLLDEVRDKHKNIKQCLKYVQVMEDAIEKGYTLEEIKYKLAKVKFTKYKGRTEYYKKAMDILE